MKKYISFLALALICSFLLSSCIGLRSDDSELTVDSEKEETKASQTTEDTESEKAEPIPALKDNRTVICLDAGHGFRDVGCDTDLLNGTEAEVNLAVTLLLKEELERRGATVILTHDGETFPTCEEIIALADRKGIEYKADSLIENDIFSAYERAVYAASIAEESAIDLFISLHVNSLEGHPEVSRYEIDYHENNPYTDFLAPFCETLKEKLEKDKETVVFCDATEEAFIVTKPDTHPSVLIEMGYATSELDAGDLNSDQWRREFVCAVADSVMESIEKYNEE